MIKKQGLIFLIFLLVCGCGPTNHQYKVYLGDDADSRFAIGLISLIPGQDVDFLQFLDYHTYNHELLKETPGEKVIRDGFFLKGKSVIFNIIDARAVFGNKKDSCRLLYQTTVSRIRVGKSAFVSLMNIAATISEKKIQKPQNPPDTSFSSVETKGTISLGTQPLSFYYKHRYSEKPAYEGWLANKNDTFIIRPATMLKNEDGKIINTRSYYSGGFEIFKGDNIIAAYEDYSPTSVKKVYILKQLGEDEKMMIASYLFLVACYR